MTLFPIFQDEFLQEMDRLKKAFMDERHQLENEVKHLRRELEEISKIRSGLEQKLHETEKLTCLLKEKKQWHEKQIADQKAVIAELKDEKHQLEEEKRKISEEVKDRITDLVTEREQAAVAAEVKALQSTGKINADDDNKVSVCRLMTTISMVAYYRCSKLLLMLGVFCFCFLDAVMSSRFCHK